MHSLSTWPPWWPCLLLISITESGPGLHHSRPQPPLSTIEHLALFRSGTIKSEVIYVRIKQMRRLIVRSTMHLTCQTFYYSTDKELQELTIIVLFELFYHCSNTGKKGTRNLPEKDVQGQCSNISHLIFQDPSTCVMFTIQVILQNIFLY